MQAANVHQGGNARPAHLVEYGQPLGHQLAVLAHQRGQVGHGADSDEIEQAGLIARGPVGQGQPQRLGQLVGDAHAGQHAFGVSRVVTLGVDDRRGRGQVAADAVVVGDDDVQTDGKGVGRLNG